MKINDVLSMWLEFSVVSEDIKNELRGISCEKELEDRFYKELEFGTRGLRGIIGAGTNRMNVYTVAKATQGYANYLNSKFENPKVAIAYDSRNMSKEFAMATALTFAANNIHVDLFGELRPTPELSFAVRDLGCQGGIVITASHNPKEYNGYKVYGEDGCQITDVAAGEIISYINKIDIFNDVKKCTKVEAIEKRLLDYIGNDIDEKYIGKVKDLVIRKDLVGEKAKDLKIVYTPIHGSGLMLVKRALTELGFEDLNIVKEQEMADGNFPTVSYPNPEEKSVFNLALELAKDIEPDVIFGTDPDCDRIGVVVKDSTEEYKVLTGNQTGMLLTEYILNSLKETDTLSDNGAIIKTIVTTEGIRNIAKAYGVEVIDTLTGFKYIGEKIAEFEKTNSKDFIFGLEESYGYLSGTFVRDKDAVISSVLIAEMSLYYKTKGLSLYDALISLYNKYGYTQEHLVSVELKGKEGQEKIANCIDGLRNNLIKDIDGVLVKEYFDYKKSELIDMETEEVSEFNLPKSNVLKYILANGSWFVVRPSGTEPKMKIYLAVQADSLEAVKIKREKFEKSISEIVNSYL